MTPLLALLGLCLPVVTLGYILLCAASPWGTCSGAAPAARTAPAGPATAPACGPASAGSSTPTCAASTGTAPDDGQPYAAEVRAYR